MLKFPLDFSNYLSIIIPSISTIYKIFTKVYYATQVSVCPPTFVLFVNDKRLFDSDYERYLSNQLRDNLPFSEIPLKFYFRPKKREAKIGSEEQKDLGGRRRK